MDGIHREGVLLGRERELDAIDRALALAIAGEGSGVVLEGPAGIGKTALTRAAARTARAEGLTVLTSRGDEGETPLAFGVVRQLFERALHDHPGDVLAGSGKLALPALEASPVEGGAQGEGVDPYAVLHGLFWVCSNLGERAPLLLVVDDLHWADPASVRFLAYLARRLADLPIVLLTAFRTGEPVDRQEFGSLLTGSDSQVLDLAPLDVAAASALIRDEVGADATDEFCTGCHTATGGNPFLLGELARSVGEQGLEPTGAAVDYVMQATPAAVLRSVEARLARLPEEARALATGIAVAGPQSQIEIARRIAGLDQETAAEAADALAAAGIVTGTTRIEFVHPLIRTAVYQQLGPGARITAHRIAADHLRAAGGAGEQAAIHLLHVPPANDPGRVATLVRAAEAATARGVPETAVSYLLRALDEPPADNERGWVLFELGRAEATQAARESLAHLGEALDLITGLEPKIKVLRETAYAMAANFGLFGEAGETLGQARTLAGNDDPELALLLWSEQLNWATLNDDPPLSEVVPEVERAARGLTGATEGERAMLAVLTWARMSQGRPVREVREAGVAALADGRLVADLGAASLTVAICSFSLAHTLSRDELESLLPQHMHAARTSGSRHAVGVHMHSAGILAHLCGELHDAEALLREGLDALIEVNSVGVSTLVGLYSDVLRDRGVPDLAWAELEKLGFAGELPPAHSFGQLRLCRGRLRVARGDVEGGLDDIMAAGDVFRRWGVVSPAYGPWRSAAAEAYRAIGDTARAADLLTEELDIARAAELDFLVGRARRLLAACEGGEAGIDGLREAVAILEPSNARLEYAHALIDLGAALRRENRRGSSRPAVEEAREHLRNGIDLAQRCGAARLVEFGQTELGATGARQRQVAISGPDSLTASERRVGRMAAEGMSNREIAEALFVTLKTVEKHLGNCYRKLGISSRRDVARALADPTAKR